MLCHPCHDARLEINGEVQCFTYLGHWPVRLVHTSIMYVSLCTVETSEVMVIVAIITACACCTFHLYFIVAVINDTFIIAFIG